MTLHQLRIFAAVAKHLNVTKAAEELHISQPSVSQQLRLLEEECRAKLYLKTGRGIDLTDAGRLFLRDAEPILIQIEKLTNKFRNNDERRVESLTVGGSFGPSASFLPSIAVLFREGHPRVEVTILTDISPALEELVLKGEVEIAVVINPSYGPNIMVEPCRKEELVWCVSVRHPLARRSKMTLKELEGVPLILRKGQGKGDSGAAWGFIKQLERQGLRLNIAMHCQFPEVVRAAIKAGAGLGILHRDMAEPEVRAGHLKIIKTPGLEMRADSFIIYHKERPLSPNAAAFLALMRKWGQKTSLRAKNAKSGVGG